MNEEKKITAEQELNILFLYKRNIELFNRIKRFVSSNINFDNYDFKEGITNDHIINIVILDHLNSIIFPILETILIFQHEPFKCLSWIKGTLKHYETSYAEFLKSLILEGLQDTRRFPTELTVITHDLSEYGCSNLSKEPNITCGMFEYFTGKNSYSDISKILESHFAVRGCLKTKTDIIDDFIKDHRNEIVERLQFLNSQPIRVKADILKENLQKGGFFNLEKVQSLSEIGQNELIKLLSDNEMPYGIAMFDYLGFCVFLDKEKGTKYKTNHFLSKLYNKKAKDGTQAKHYRNSLINNKSRYTSYLHKETVAKDYEQLK